MKRWTISKCSQHPDNIDIRDTDGETVFCVERWKSDPIDEHLIINAPKMYTMLENIVNQSKEIKEVINGGKSYAVPPELLEQTKELLKEVQN